MHMQTSITVFKDEESISFQKASWQKSPQTSPSENIF